MMIKYIFIAAFLLINTSIAADRKESITPENSTTIFYKTAHDAFKNKINELQNLKNNDTVPGLKHTKAEYEESLKFAYLHNILWYGWHLGTAEKFSPYRGWVKAGDQGLGGEIVKLYSERYLLQEGGVLRKANPNPVDDSYLIFSEGYVPHRLGEKGITPDETKYIQSLLNEYYKDYPGISNYLPSLVDYPLMLAWRWVRSFL